MHKGNGFLVFVCATTLGAAVADESPSKAAIPLLPAPTFHIGDSAVLFHGSAVNRKLILSRDVYNKRASDIVSGRFMGPGRVDYTIYEDPAFKEWSAHVAANEQTGLEEMVKKGHAVEVENGTKIVIIDQLSYGQTRARVTIQEGTSKGVTCWIPQEYLSRTADGKVFVIAEGGVKQVEANSLRSLAGARPLSALLPDQLEAHHAEALAADKDFLKHVRSLASRKGRRMRLRPFAGGVSVLGPDLPLFTRFHKAALASIKDKDTKEFLASKQSALQKRRLVQLDDASPRVIVLDVSKTFVRVRLIDGDGRTGWTYAHQVVPEG